MYRKIIKLSLYLGVAPNAAFYHNSGHFEFFVYCFCKIFLSLFIMEHSGSTVFVGKNTSTKRYLHFSQSEDNLNKRQTTPFFVCFFLSNSFFASREGTLLMTHTQSIWIAILVDFMLLRLPSLLIHGRADRACRCRAVPGRYFFFI